MAIVKVGTYRNPPEDITDYESIVAHLEAYTRQVGNQGMILTEWTNTTNAPKIAIGSYISHGGVLYVVEDEDYLLPSLSSDGTYYIRVAVSGDTLALDYITDLTGYVWNAIYNGLYHPDGKQVLPYQVVKNASAIEKYKMLNPWQVDDFAVVNYLGRYHGRELHVTGAISGASVDTGQGATEVHLMNQNLRTTDTPYWSEVGVTNGTYVRALKEKGIFKRPESNTFYRYVGNITQDDLFQKIGSAIPVGSELLIIGGIMLYTNIPALITAVKKENSYSITVHCILLSSGALHSFTCTSGNTTNVAQNISVSW
jgi:hypothetical protein